MSVDYIEEGVLIFLFAVSVAAYLSEVMYSFAKHGEQLYRYYYKV